MTIREYLENTDTSYARSLKTRNMGAKSANELREIVSAFARHRARRGEPMKSEASDPGAESPAGNPRDLIISALSQIKFPEALFDFDLSGRLKRVLEKFAADQGKGRQPAASLSTVGHVVNKWNNTRSALIRFGNIGSKSLDELKGFTEKVINRRFQQLFPHIRLREPLHIEDLSHGLSPNIARELNGISNSTAVAVQERRDATRTAVEYSEPGGAILDSGYWKFCLFRQMSG
jgi:hypothetical protein